MLLDSNICTVSLGTVTLLRYFVSLDQLISRNDASLQDETKLHVKRQLKDTVYISDRTRTSELAVFAMLD